ncbi:hypothetical protein DRO91_07130, partial [Candidatus Heimdallarchaeota archaeon]
MNFYEFDQKLEQRRLVISILEQNGYNPDDFDIDFLIEAGILQRMGDWAKEKGKKFTLPLALAAGIGGFGGMGQGSAAAATPTSTPAATSSIRQVKTSELSSFHNLFQEVGQGVYQPKEGNGVLVKGKTSVAQDELKGHEVDLSKYHQQTPGKTVTANGEGSGMSWEEALKDALSNAGGQGLGTLVDSETLVKNDKILRDRIITSNQAVIHGFQLIKLEDQGDGIWRAVVQADVSIPTGLYAGSE